MGEVQQIRQAEEPWVTADEAAAHFGFTGAWIRDLARKGHIPARQFGFAKRKFWRFRVSEIERAYRQEA